MKSLAGKLKLPLGNHQWERAGSVRAGGERKVVHGTTGPSLPGVWRVDGTPAP